jgi:hypothetical protein
VNPLLIPVLAIGAGTFALGWRLAALRQRYYLTGFFIVVTKRRDAPP